MILPLCAGCGVTRVKGKDRRYCCPTCVPRSVRAGLGSEGGRLRAYRQRARMFRADIARLTADGKRVGQDDLLVLLMTVYRRGEHCGRQGAYSRAKAPRVYQPEQVA